MTALFADLEITTGDKIGMGCCVLTFAAIPMLLSGLLVLSLKRSATREIEREKRNRDDFDARERRADAMQSRKARKPDDDNGPMTNAESDEIPRKNPTT